MRQSRVQMIDAYRDYCLRRHAGHTIDDASAYAHVSRATGYRFEGRRVGRIEVSDSEPVRTIASSTRVKIAGMNRERKLVAAWLAGSTFPEIGKELGISYQGAQKALERLWRSTRWHAVLAGIEGIPPVRVSMVRRCVECGFVTSFPRCPRCSRPRRPVLTVAQEL